MTFRSVRFIALATLLVPLAFAAGTLMPVPAHAHEGAAIIEVDQEHPGVTATHYFIRVTWEDDGHAVVDGTVTATAISPSGVEQAPVPLNMYDADEGLYEGTVEMPEEGTWTVRFTSVDPTGSIEHTQEMIATAPVEPETERTPEDASADSAGSADDDAAPADDPSLEATAASNEGGSGPSILVLALVFLLLAAAVAGTFWLVVRHGQAATAEADAAGDAADDTADADTADADTVDTADADTADTADTAADTAHAKPHGETTRSAR